MTNSAKYYIWLTQALGYNNPKLKALHEMYDSIEDFYHAGEMEWRLSGILTNKDIAAMEKHPFDEAFKVYQQCNRMGYTLVSFDDAAYPKRLYETYAPPAVIYVWGRLPDFNRRLCISIVGTRNATAYGKQVTHVLAGSLAKLGAVVISGGATGIDSAAHTGALESQGATVCVLGCGLNHPYLMSQYALRRSIAETCAVISEYPPDYPAGKFTFPERNRIIAGLSHGVVVVEAGQKSGSLITAKYAAEYDRDVFAVMGNITSPFSAGANALIKDGAVPVTAVGDIIEYYPQFTIEAPGDSMVQPVPKHKTDIDVSDDARTVYALITADPVHIDTLTSRSGLPVSRVLQALTELEIESLISSLPGRMYQLL